MSSNALISSAKATESSLHAALHPLVLLTISDYITRHTLRKLTQPIVGALIGQLHGREISIEHAYDVKLVQDEGKWQINDEWFSERLQQYKDVHKAPILDLVGWWTVSASIGPTPEILDIHRQVMKHNETALLLTFHPEAILQGTAAGGKLPLTIYETIYENIRSRDGAGDEAMQVEGEETGEKLEPRFKELRHEIATGEAEMISVDFVARGGGNATAVESRVNPHAVNAPNKGKEKATESKADPASTNLNSEEGECKCSSANPLAAADAVSSDLIPYISCQRDQDAPLANILDKRLPQRASSFLLDNCGTTRYSTGAQPSSPARHSSSSRKATSRHAPRYRRFRTRASI